MTQVFDYSNKKALVLDDNPQMRAILRSMLATVKLRSVAEYSEPLAAMDHLVSTHVDIAIIDLVLGGSIDGIELSDRIRHNKLIVNPTMPIIMVTGYPSVAVIDQAINVGVDELVVKPLRARDLVARVCKVVERPRAYIRTPSKYFGPDRRRRDNEKYNGPDRRKADLAEPVESLEAARAAIARVRPDAFTEQRSIDNSIVLLDL